MEKKSVDFQLSEKLEYSSGGDFQQTATIVMSAPNMEVFDQFSSLSQLVMGAFKDAQRTGQPTDQEIAEAKEKIDEKGMEPEEIKLALFSAHSVKFTEVANEFKRLAVKVCEVAEGIKMEHVLFDRMNIDDFINMVCTYIANFITPSLL